MFAEIQKLEAAARIAMGYFEGEVTRSTKPRSSFSLPAYAFLALILASGFAIALF